ncbi:histidine phosphatase family protein [Tessaracoccus sp. HDW20]|uniref:histidine phosphatase family protein n=1 Tax=Tessaracoccus coleopterorum TaxID=2714950 RepID=UPI001E4A63A8|nr:histidine phosphatase family protein [Tessaracoccus coleopterorum]NHB85327.1 histidine phosphatase family protein [Tessaracoccus coleopterorum]
MRLLLIRHGQTEANVNRQLDTAHPGLPLNELGLSQAEALVAALEHEQIDALYASTLTRAQQTAAPLAAARGLEAVVLEGIHEISAGVEEMNTDWRRYLEVLTSWAPDNLDVGLEGGETAREFLTRFNAAVAKVEEGGHDNVALVSHGAALRVWAITQDPSVGMENAQPLENTQWIVLNGSTAEGWKAERWGTFVVPVDGEPIAVEHRATDPA